MKKNRILIGIMLVSTSITACAAPETDAVNSDIKTDSTETSDIDAEEIQSSFHYDEDWDALKEAIYKKDTETIQAFISDPELKAATIIELCSEDFVIKKLKATNYDALMDSEFNGEFAKEFNASEEYTDEEGNEYGTGISIFLEEGMQGLRILYVLAAG